MVDNGLNVNLRKRVNLLYMQSLITYRWKFLTTDEAECVVIWHLCKPNERPIQHPNTIW